MSTLDLINLNLTVMATIKSLNKWANAHTNYPMDILRFALGVFLFIKGVNFLANTQILLELFKPLESYAGGMLLVHYVAPAHLVGGILIFVGLLTRWATIAQLPILIGAVLINFVGELQVVNLLLAILILLLCVFFIFYGSGKHSMDYYMKMQQ